MGDLNMEIDNVNKTRTYIVVLVFVIIILLSAYVVINKITERTGQDIKVNNLNNITNNILKDSSVITELSLNNKNINNLYKYINNKDIEYELYKYKNKEFDWNIKSLIASKNISSHDTSNLEVLYFDREKFEEKYKEIFNEEASKLSIEYKTASICGAASYDFENDVYVVNLNCNKDNNVKTFYKNVTLDDDKIVINKYYIFTYRYINNEIVEYSLYKTSKKDEQNLLTANIKYEEISNYISDMNVISYVYSKSNDGKYYLNGVK